jgi:isopentenyl-diphosphate delta-isomerase
MIPAIAADQSLYPIEKMEAHRLGVFHQAISAFVFSQSGELLIQRRAAAKYHCGGLWANTCCTHPHFGETHEACAARRMQEELGLVVPLDRRTIVEYRADVGGGLWEHERVVVFRGQVDADTAELELNPEEVSETRWVALDQLRREVSETPQAFTPWFRIYLRRWDELSL